MIKSEYLTQPQISKCHLESKSESFPSLSSSLAAFRQGKKVFPCCRKYQSQVYLTLCSVFIYSVNLNLVKNACPRLEILALETKASTTVSITPKTLRPSSPSTLSPWPNYGRNRELFTQFAEPGAPSQGGIRPLCSVGSFLQLEAKACMPPATHYLTCAQQ